MTLPRKRKPQRMGVKEAVQKIWPRHRRFVKAHGCCVPYCLQEPIEFSHIRTAANSGVSIKPHDCSAVPMCGVDVTKGQEGHHGEYHRIGHQSFEAKHKLNLKALAAEFVRKSPDQAMRDSLKLVSLESA